MSNDLATNMNRTFADFRPFPLLAGGHLQTVAGLYLPSRDGFVDTEQHLLELDDGDQMVLHEDLPANWMPGDPVVIFVHGLCGSHASPYVRRLGWKMYCNGIRVFRLDLRGSGAGLLLAKTGTHCGRHADLLPALDKISRLAPRSPLSLVGYSLGAALALNLAAELGPRSLGTLQNVVAVCPPVDLFAVEEFLQRPVRRNYDLFFTRRLWQVTVLRSQRVEGAPQVLHLPRPRRLREFDERITAPLGGYRDASDYYRRTSVGPRLSAIELNTLIVASADDPIIPIAPLQGAKVGPRTEVVVTSRGGHLGYVGKLKGDPDRRWIDWRILEWLSARGPHPHEGQFAEAAATELV
jgi:predicted alpha/beta-fold hydrolase